MGETSHSDEPHVAPSSRMGKIPSVVGHCWLTFAFPVGRRPGRLRNLVLAAPVQPHQDNQVGQRKQPLIRLLTSTSAAARDETHVAGLRQAVQVLYGRCPSGSQSLRP